MLKKKFCKTIIFFLIFFVFSQIKVFSAEQTWTIAAEKFTYTKGQKQSALTEATAVMFSSRILEKMNSSLYRTISADENVERLRYDSRKERTSLFLQLSSAIQKRDALVLQNYSDSELKKKIAEQEEAIAEIREQISENIKTVEEEEKKSDPDYVQSENNLGFIEKYTDKIKSFFNSEDSVISQEQVTFYKNDVTAFFTPSNEAEEAGFTSDKYQSEILTAGIDGLLRGTITAYGEFISLTVDLYYFPGAKLIGSVTEIGSLEDADFIATSISRQLVPLISNSMPVILNISVFPQEILKTTSVYIDELYYPQITSQILTDSGVHRIEFNAEGYKSISTSYYFSGNHSYNITVNMEKTDDGIVFLNLAKPMAGDLFANGIFQNQITTLENEEGKEVSSTSKININGTSILGEFIGEDGNSAFFYIPQNYLVRDNYLSLSIKTFDRSEYIEKRRKIMYGSYSALVVSLIPNLIFSGYYNKYDDAGEAAAHSLLKSGKMVFTGLSIAAGAFFAYEFVRYLMAANTVLPPSPKVTKLQEFYAAPVKSSENTETAAATESAETAKTTESAEDTENNSVN